MRNRLAYLIVAGTLLFFPFDIFALNGNGIGDYVTGVYVCGTKILIQTKSEGWVYVDSTDPAVGQPVAAEMLAVALQLLNNGKQIGQFYEPTGKVVGTGCGFSAAEITTLMASNLP